MPGAHNGSGYVVDQVARDAARDAISAIRAHVQLWERGEAARDRRDGDFREFVADWLKRIQASYEDGQTRQESLHALAVSDVRADLAATNTTLQQHAEDDSKKFRGLYARLWATSVALNAILLSVCGYLIAHKGL